MMTELLFLTADEAGDAGLAGDDTVLVAHEAGDAVLAAHDAVTLFWQLWKLFFVPTK